MNVSTHKNVENVGKNLVQHFGFVKNNWLLKNMPKYSKFDKNAKPKILMPTTSKKCQISKIGHKNMPVGNNALQCRMSASLHFGGCRYAYFHMG